MARTRHCGTSLLSLRLKVRLRGPFTTHPRRDRTNHGWPAPLPARGGFDMAATKKRVLIFAENDYEDLELWYPKLRLIEAGVQVTVAGPREKVYKSKHGYPAETDGNVRDFRAADFDGVVVPGGWCPDRLRRYEEVLAFTREIASAGKLVAAVCHGGWV